MSLVRHSASELLAELEAGSVSSVEVTTAFLDQIRKHDPQVKAFLRVDPGRALERAADVDRRRREGKPLGRLAGLPVAIKDLLCTAGEPTTCASQMLERFAPPYDATVIAAAQGGRRGADRQDEHGRVRHGRLDRKLGLPEDAPIPGTSNAFPAAPAAGPRRAVAAAHGPAVDRHRHRRLDSPARRPVRRDRAEADLRPRQPLRPGGLRQQPRPDRPAGAHGRGCGLAAGGACRPRPAATPRRSTCPCPPTAKTVGEPLEGLRLGLVREHFGAGLDAEVERAVREAVARLRVARGDGQGAVAAACQLRRGDVLHHRAVRGLEQSGPLRRRPLRPSHRREGDAWPSWRPSARRWKPPATMPRPRRSTIRWCGCIAAAGPKALAPR